MRKLAWIIDSTCGHAEELTNDKNIFILPLLVTLDGVSYLENIDINDEEFYAKLPTLQTPPTTSQPKLHDVVVLFEKLKEEGFEGIVLSLSSELSGTYSTIQMAKSMTNSDNIHVIDTLSGAYPTWKMLEHGTELAKRGIPTNEIVASIEAMKRKNDFYIIPKDLQQLGRSGRVSGMQLFIGSLLRISPILAFDGEGRVDSVDKVRSLKAAKSWIIDKINERLSTHNIKEIGIMHGFDPEAANDWKASIQAKFPQIKIDIDRFSMPICVHNGQGTIGIACMYE